MKLLIIFCFILLIKLITCGILTGFQLPSPGAKHGSNFDVQHSRGLIESRINGWTPADGNNPWEMSGLYQGDIMLYDYDMHPHQRNGLLDEMSHWSNATVPYYIEEDDFDDDQIRLILTAFQEYHNKTCVRFRKYQKDDKNWILLRSNDSGCWSSVGMRDGGQVVNLQSPGCVHHGVVVHELMHALGFYHQQSAPERDGYVKINWENIDAGKENNFNKYNHTYVDNYGACYDYDSVMHYSEKAFSKNGKPTIESLKPNTKLGQRKGLSDKDVRKMNEMYSDICKANRNREAEDDLNKLFNYIGDYGKK